MSEFREPKIKVCKVDINILLEKICEGPPKVRNIATQYIRCLMGEPYVILIGKTLNFFLVT